AGKSAWWALLFFVPVANYLLMAGLSLLPSTPVPAWRRATPAPVVSDRLKSGLLGVAAALAITIPTLLLGVYFQKSYSAGLFLGTPFTIGYISAYVFNHRHPRTPPPLQEILTVVDIDAPPQTVWRNVISFPDLPATTERLFRIGVAAPLRARVEGAGVGAIRYCDFNTGSFVEPITDWEENRLLRFDITAQAPPMREWSPYRDVNPPHLDGYFRATRGEFRLLALPGGGTRLEGRTWYEVEMSPQPYWKLYSDWIVRTVQLRALGHIKRPSENAKEG